MALRDKKTVPHAKTRLTPANDNRRPNNIKLVVDNTTNLVPHPTVDTEYLKELERQRGIGNAKVTKKKQKWDDTKPRELDRNERVRRINAREKGGLLNRVAKNRRLRRIANIKGKKKGSLLKKLAAKGVLRMITYAGFYIWLLQVALFILYLFALFVASISLENIIDAVIEASPVPIPRNALLLALSFPNPLTPFIIAIIGIEIFNSYVDVMSIFLVLYAATVAVGWLALLLIGFIYKMSPISIHPLGGTKSTMKLVLLMLMFILHAIPFLNFAPWFLIWAWYISKHPE